MRIGIKYGGSGNIKTSVLEDAQEQILRARTVKAKAHIDSNLVMQLISEVLITRRKYPACPVSEFTLSDSLEIPPDSYVEPRMEDLESRTDSEIVDVEDDELEEDLEEDTIEIRKPTPPKKRKVLARSSDYWLDGGSSTRTAAITGLLVMVGIVVVVLTTL